MSGSANAGSNPLFDRYRPSPLPTINGLPIALLGNKLPPPRACPECGFPVWELDDPVARRTVDGRDVPVHIQMRGEYAPLCTTVIDGRSAINLQCQHPFHLVPHERCTVDRPHPAFPAGLIDPNAGRRM